MKNKKLLMLGTALATVSGLVAATKARSASDTGTIDATIVEAITISSTQNLDFGSIAADAGNADTVVLTTAGAISAPGGFAQLLGGHTVGRFAVTGQATLGLDYAFSAATYTVDDTGAGTPMNVTSMVMAFGDGTGAITVAEAGSLTNVAMPADGDGVVFVGGTLNVGVGQTAGAYTGTYVVNADYN